MLLVHSHWGFNCECQTATFSTRHTLRGVLGSGGKRWQTRYWFLVKTHDLSPRQLGKLTKKRTRILSTSTSFRLRRNWKRCLTIRKVSAKYRWSCRKEELRSVGRAKPEGYDAGGRLPPRVAQGRPWTAVWWWHGSIITWTGLFQTGVALLPSGVGKANMCHYFSSEWIGCQKIRRMKLTAASLKKDSAKWGKRPPV